MFSETQVGFNKLSLTVLIVAVPSSVMVAPTMTKLLLLQLGNLERATNHNFVYCQDASQGSIDTNNAKFKAEHCCCSVTFDKLNEEYPITSERWHCTPVCSNKHWR